MNLDDLPDEQCAWCNKEYQPFSIAQKYCSATCRKASISAFQKQAVRSNLAALKCRHCGDPILNAKKTDARYCSGTCRNAARRVREHGPLSAVKCCDCGKKIPGVIRRDTLRCPVCIRADHRKRNRERARERRAMLHPMSHGNAGPHEKGPEMLGSQTQHECDIV